MNNNKSNQDFLLSHQYATGKNLQARINLHKKYSTNPYNWFRWVFEHFSQENSANILEIGCGPGTLWKENTDRIPDSWEVILSDLSFGMVLEARQGLHNQNNKFSFYVCDGQSIPSRNDTFDIVIANHMLYHIPDRPAALSEFQRVLKTSGIFIAATNGSAHMQELFHIGSFLIPDLEDYSREKFSQMSFTLENGAEQLKEFFNQVEIKVFEDSLKITDAGPLVDYILSIINPLHPNINMKNIQEFQTQVKQIIQEQGTINVKKSTGLLFSYSQKQ
jgi:ubiquinone/menaquinone biosynthesis C-methylase UbiE